MKTFFFFVLMLVSFPIFSQSMFSGGQGGYVVPTPTTIITETVFKTVVVEGQEVIFGVEKIIEDKTFTYDVHFLGADDQFDYDKGNIKITDFEVVEGTIFYTVLVYYDKTDIYYDITEDRLGNEHKHAVYNYSNGHVAFSVKKYGIK